MSFEIDPQLLGLVDNVALVTGAGAGIGRATAIQLARAGCHVAAVDFDGDKAAATAAEIEGLGRKSVAIQADVRDPASVKEFVDTARNSLGPLDVAANVVGGALITRPFLDLTIDDWELVIRQNLFSAAIGCQAESIAMIEDQRKGRLINVASSSGIAGAPNIAPYGAAKAGIIHMTRTISVELAPFGIRVNCVVPGMHSTERSKKNLADPETPQRVKDFWQKAIEQTPLRRLGDPFETAGVAVFLASELSSYVTGHIVISDGGVLNITACGYVGGKIPINALAHLSESFLPPEDIS